MSHNHSHSASGKKLLICLVIILFFAFVEAIGGWWANSLALLSDAGHMFADSFSLILAAVASWIAAKPPSSKHTFGYERAEVIGASLSSLFLLLIVIAIGAEAIDRLIKGEAVIAGGVVTVIAIIGLLSNILVVWILSRGEKNLNIRAALLHVFGDLLGSVAAIAAGVVIIFSGWMPIDAILSLLICVLILFASIRLLRETLIVLMEGVPKHLDLEKIGNRMAEVEGVVSIHDLHIWNLSSTRVMLTAHIVIKDAVNWTQCFPVLHNMLENEFGVSHITLQPEVLEFVMKRMEKDNT